MSQSDKRAILEVRIENAEKELQEAKENFVAYLSDMKEHDDDITTEDFYAAEELIATTEEKVNKLRTSLEEMGEDEGEEL